MALRLRLVAALVGQAGAGLGHVGLGHRSGREFLLGGAQGPFQHRSLVAVEQHDAGVAGHVQIGGGGGQQHGGLAGPQRRAFGGDQGLGLCHFRTHPATGVERLGQHQVGVLRRAVLRLLRGGDVVVLGGRADAAAQLHGGAPAGHGAGHALVGFAQALPLGQQLRVVEIGLGQRPIERRVEHGRLRQGGGGQQGQ